MFLIADQLAFDALMDLCAADETLELYPMHAC
jgi:hypothetical protein